MTEHAVDHSAVATQSVWRILNGTELLTLVTTTAEGLSHLNFAYFAIDQQQQRGCERRRAVQSTAQMDREQKGEERGAAPQQQHRGTSGRDRVPDNRGGPAVDVGFLAAWLQRRVPEQPDRSGPESLRSDPRDGTFDENAGGAADPDRAAEEASDGGPDGLGVAAAVPGAQASGRHAVV